MTNLKDLTIEEWLRGLKTTANDALTADLVWIYRTRLHGVGREVVTRTAWRHVTGETIPTMDVQRALTSLSKGKVTLEGLRRAKLEWAKRQAKSKPKPATRRRGPPAKTSEDMEADARSDHD